MPTYNYECKHCNTRFEALRPLEERTETRCPFCSRMAQRNMEGELPLMVGDMEPHFNHSLNAYIGSRREWREHLAFNNAYDPNIERGSEPKDGRLTREERAELEGSNIIVDRGASIFDKRRRPGWGTVPVDPENPIETDGNAKADYDSIKADAKRAYYGGENR